MFHIIDDEPMLRELLDAIIDDAGFSSRSFESGEAYLRFLHSPDFEKPTAILSDVSMPGMTGYDLAFEIRKVYPLQKVVLITGNVNDEHVQQVDKYLCYTLAKPFDPETIIDLLISLNACEEAHKHNASLKYFQECKFAIHHNCPFNQTPSNASQTDACQF